MKISYWYKHDIWKFIHFGCVWTPPAYVPEISTSQLINFLKNPTYIITFVYTKGTIYSVGTCFNMQLHFNIIYKRYQTYLGGFIIFWYLVPITENFKIIQIKPCRISFFTKITFIFNLSFFNQFLYLIIFCNLYACNRVGNLLYLDNLVRVFRAFWVIF